MKKIYTYFLNLLHLILRIRICHIGIKSNFHIGISIANHVEHDNSGQLNTLDNL